MRILKLSWESLDLWQRLDTSEIILVWQRLYPSLRRSVKWKTWRVILQETSIVSSWELVLYQVQKLVLYQFKNLCFIKLRKLVLCQVRALCCINSYSWTMPILWYCVVSRSESCIVSRLESSVVSRLVLCYIKTI